ncbi:MAG: hypothetical protein AB8G22_09315 [Saprospiraceae bacterium]
MKNKFQKIEQELSKILTEHNELELLEMVLDNYKIEYQVKDYYSLSKNFQPIFFGTTVKSVG